MDNITTVDGLKNAIQLLEIEQAENKRQFKEHLQITLENLRPVNLAKSALSELVSSPVLIDNILATVAGLVTGFLSKKIFVSISGNKFKNLLGSVLQFGVTNIIKNHPEAILSFGRFITKQFFSKKVKEPLQSQSQ